MAGAGGAQAVAYNGSLSIDNQNATAYLMGIQVPAGVVDALMQWDPGATCVYNDPMVGQAYQHYRNQPNGTPMAVSRGCLGQANGQWMLFVVQP